jgi:hypothetical protein
MSDLSKVLGDLYEADAPAAPAYQATAPAWADEARLDEAFAQWTPGPPADAPAAEREFAPVARLDDDIAANLSAALVADEQDGTTPWEEVEALAPSVAPAPPVQVPAWRRADDDIFPGTSGNVANSPKVKLPKAVKAPKAVRAPKAQKPAASEGTGDKQPLKVFGLQLRRK